ncbi:MAG: purine-nucleoside phosphorylase [Eubacteriales bacterium]|nr:purine-nucleoside phosphorylase [Eubacteriales bacterium]
MPAKTLTPHIGCTPDDLGKTVLMPGDPLRSKFIAGTFLEEPRLVNNIRGIQGYTGTYKGKKVSVMASGMGMPSIGIYSHELFNVFGVENIIRVGTAGGIHPSLKLRDIVVGMGACTNSNFASQFKLPGTFAPIASYKLLRAAVEEGERRGARMMVGNLFSSDTFYDDAMSTKDWSKMGVLAVEMEAAGLYMEAARAGKNALAICTISDLILTGEECTPEERQTTFTTMMEIALSIAE